MFLLETVDPEKAQGKVAEAYSIFKNFGAPIPLRLLSASPDLQERQTAMIGYFMGHPRLSPGLLASIRFAIASKTGHLACEALNRDILGRMGVNEQEIAGLPTGAAETPLEESEEALFRFVLRSFDDPASANARDIQALRALGWQDADILDAMFHAAGMLASSVLFKTFVRA
ncbi:hypothetical protein NNJEOMEG_01466 [Fundidesulfovibrio magnetotacticus]|uniref:Carboxymuconolactone decarboxylase-like domain-containing protein n=1 Tax=Fundidesulfovibrio magnetotacticus TaxID=2730080 RepID=A0A6V8LLU0_9BACT|nr:hypothetical protein [Fundidesulfovibrio magnetotacticus]GFK93632.1 hypothetical protein NNJEOMEG_01466 [Fundidesulfovibrio magnetotacticus]